MIDKYVRHTKTKNFFDKKRKEQTVFWFENLVEEKIRNQFFSDADFLKRYNEAKINIQKNITTILNAVDFVFKK